MGIWTEVEPRTRTTHDWVFAHYVETPSERTDGRWFEALYFRDASRSRFGKLEFDHLAKRDFRDLATKVALDRAYRESLYTDDPDLPRLWRKR